MPQVQPILVVSGSIHYDLILQVPRLPQENDRIVPTATTLAPGGMGGNVVAAFARLGGTATARFVGHFTDDPDGGALRDDLIRDGVDLRWAGTRVGGPNHRGMILVDAQGQRAILGAAPEPDRLERAPGQAPGLVQSTASRWTERGIPAFTPIPSAAFDAPHVAFACPFNYAPLVLASVPAHCPTYMDIETGHVTGWSDDEIWATLRRATVVYGNERNLQDLARRLDEPSVTSLSRTLGGTVIETAGALGAQIHNRGQRTVVPGFPVEPVDTTGAGDCFAAACTLALLKGATQPEAVRFANAAAALSTRHLGSRPGVPQIAEVDALLAPPPRPLERTARRQISRLFAGSSPIDACIDNRESFPPELFAETLMHR